MALPGLFDLLHRCEPGCPGGGCLNMSTHTRFEKAADLWKLVLRELLDQVMYDFSPSVAHQVEYSASGGRSSPPPTQSRAHVSSCLNICVHSCDSHDHAGTYHNFITVPTPEDSRLTRSDLRAIKRIMAQPLDIEALRAAASAEQWAMSHHARIRAGKRHIGDVELVQALSAGEVLENYPDDPRGPSALVLGHTDDGRPIHAVCALDLCGTLLIVTVYEPEPPHWIDERTRGERGGA